MAFLPVGLVGGITAWVEKGFKGDAGGRGRFAPEIGTIGSHRIMMLDLAIC
jgi:hypothetical protein